MKLRPGLCIQLICRVNLLNFVFNVIVYAYYIFIIAFESNEFVRIGKEFGKDAHCAAALDKNKSSICY